MRSPVEMPGVHQAVYSRIWRDQQAHCLLQRPGACLGHCGAHVCCLPGRCPYWQGLQTRAGLLHPGPSPAFHAEEGRGRDNSPTATRSRCSKNFQIQVRNLIPAQSSKARCKGSPDLGLCMSFVTKFLHLASPMPLQPLRQAEVIVAVFCHNV